MPTAKGRKYTADEFFEITPESSSERYELINGEIVGLAAPNTLHQRIIMEVSAEIRNFIKRKNGKCMPFVSPFDVKLDNYNVVQPDILVVCDKNKIDDKRCNGAPDLAIEVTSSNRNRDYIDKLYMYKNSGVHEYWIIDTPNKRILKFDFETSDSPSIYTFEQDIPVGIFNNELQINIENLL